jgi:hypothetical protein
MAVHGHPLDFDTLRYSIGARLSETSEVWLKSHLSRVLRAALLLDHLVTEPQDVTLEPLQVHQPEPNHTPVAHDGDDKTSLA